MHQDIETKATEITRSYKSGQTISRDDVHILRMSNRYYFNRLNSYWDQVQINGQCASCGKQLTWQFGCKNHP
jgi:hypothetical protein